MFASVAIDVFGLLGVVSRPLTAWVALGAAAVLAGITTIVPRLTVVRPGWVLLGLVAGAVLPVQGAVNARLRADLHEPPAVALVSFVVATLTILIVVAVTRPTIQRKPVPWWGWLGCLCAAAYVTGTFLLIPTLGAATTIALTVTGQQLASALIDHVGAFRLARRPLTRTRAIGLALLLLGCLLVQLG